MKEKSKWHLGAKSPMNIIYHQSAGFCTLHDEMRFSYILYHQWHVQHPLYCVSDQAYYRRYMTFSILIFHHYRTVYRNMTFIRPNKVSHRWLSFDREGTRWHSSYIVIYQIQDSSLHWLPTSLWRHPVSIVFLSAYKNTQLLNL